MPLIELTNGDDARLRVFSRSPFLELRDPKQLVGLRLTQAVKCPTRVYSLPNRAT